MSVDVSERRSGVFGLLALASLLCLGALCVLALSLGSDHWQEIEVDRAAIRLSPLGADLENDLQFEPSFAPRNRGIFRLCFTGSETAFVGVAEEKGYGVDEGSCFIDPGIYLPTVDQRKNWGNENEAREHLMRLHLALFVLALLLLLMAVACGGLSCMRVTPNHMTTAGACALIAAFVTFGGMAVFHGYVYLEDNKIIQKPFKAFWGEQIALLERNTRVELGWSYILGWVSGAMSILTAIVYVTAGVQARENAAKMLKADKASLMRGRPMETGSVLMVKPGMMMDYPTLPQPNRPRAPPPMFYAQPPPQYY